MRRIITSLVVLLSITGTAAAFVIQTRSSSSAASHSSSRLYAKPNSNNPPNQQGEIGSGPNWIERSFPVDTGDEGASVDPKKVEDYDLGLAGASWDVGPLSARMYDAIISKSSLPTADADVQRALKIYAMDFTAKEAVRAALKQNGLELALTDDEQDEGMWGDIDSIRLLNDNNETVGPLYDSWEEAVDDWMPGQGFNFVARQVPAKMRELTLEELLQALDPEGELRKQAEQAGIPILDDIVTLNDMANENVRRTEHSPRNASQEEQAFAGLPDKRGYRVIHASDLLQDSLNADGTVNRKTLMHVMDAMVNHGCLIVDLTDGGTTFRPAEKMAAMWKTAADFFESMVDAADDLPGMQTAEGTGSPHAKVGYASADNGNLQFLETRMNRKGELLPTQARELLGVDGCSSLQEAFVVVADVGKDVVRIAVTASSVEAGALKEAAAGQAAVLMANELLDDGKPLPANTDIDHSEGSVSMSPHRLCRYSNNIAPDDGQEKPDDETTREVFGAHTDSTFVTAVPVAVIAGLEVYDEDAERWYRPELAARRHWQNEQEARGHDPELLSETVDGKELPWHARYIVVMPGELLQLVTRNEILAAVHRVVAGSDQPSRLSAPILLRGRPGTTMNVARYLGSSSGSPILDECDGMTIEQIHAAMQPTSFQ